MPNTAGWSRTRKLGLFTGLAALVAGVFAVLTSSKEDEPVVVDPDESTYQQKNPHTEQAALERLADETLRALQLFLEEVAEEARTQAATALLTWLMSKFIRDRRTTETLKKYQRNEQPSPEEKRLLREATIDLQRKDPASVEQLKELVKDTQD